MQTNYIVKWQKAHELIVVASDLNNPRWLKYSKNFFASMFNKCQPRFFSLLLFFSMLNSRVKCFDKNFSHSTINTENRLMENFIFKSIQAI